MVVIYLYRYGTNFVKNASNSTLTHKDIYTTYCYLLFVLSGSGHGPRPRCVRHCTNTEQKDNPCSKELTVQLLNLHLVFIQSAAGSRTVLSRSDLNCNYLGTGTTFFIKYQQHHAHWPYSIFCASLFTHGSTRTGKCALPISANEALEHPSAVPLSPFYRWGN